MAETMASSSALPLYEDPATIQDLHRQLKAETTSTTTTNSPALLGHFNHRLQELGLGNPIWDIIIEPGTERHANRFIGSLTIGENLPEKIVVSIVKPNEDSWGKGLPNKKAAKAILVEKAMKRLEVLQVPTKVKSIPSQRIKSEATDDNINWTGRVLEYNNSLPMTNRLLTYTESGTAASLGPQLFSCSLTIAVPCAASFPEMAPSAYTARTFPPPESGPQLFTSKKTAKQHCSRLAGQHLIAAGLIREDGSLPPKTTPQTQQASPSTDSSIVSKIPALCEELGLPPPRYTYESPSGDPSSINAFVNCSAHFPSISGLPDPAVTIHNVYGKKKAKEECAHALLGLLDKVREWRLKGGGPWTG